MPYHPAPTMARHCLQLPVVLDFTRMGCEPWHEATAVRPHLRQDAHGTLDLHGPAASSQAMQTDASQALNAYTAATAAAAAAAAVAVSPKHLLCSCCWAPGLRLFCCLALRLTHRDSRCLLYHGRSSPQVAHRSTTAFVLLNNRLRCCARCCWCH